MTRFDPGQMLARALFLGCLALILRSSSWAGENSAALRGKEALLNCDFSHASLSRPLYESLWKQWGLRERPADFDQQVRQRYGLSAAPYPNHGLPMGLSSIEGKSGPGVGLDCLLCHAGSLMGKPLIGLPNTSLDLASLVEDFASAKGLPQFMPYRLSNVRGTTEATATAIFLIAFRDPELKLQLPVNLGPVPDQMCEDAPAWWLLKKKRTMYHNGQLDARAVRPLMAFMMSPLTNGARFKQLEPTFADIREFLLSLEPPKYPLAINRDLAAGGEAIFEETCARCHGSYGDHPLYPNKTIALDKIGTDPTLVRGLTSRIETHYRQSWLSQGLDPDGHPFPIQYNHGYQAPPLDGIWATAPYFHNGSVPTLAGVLNSKDRPKIFTRSYAGGAEDFDPERVGWKVQELANSPRAEAPGPERRRVYDTTQTGRSNSGHRFGDRLSEEERRALIEYLKTL